MTNGNDLLDGNVRYETIHIHPDTGQVIPLYPQRNEPLTKREYFAALAMQAYITTKDGHTYDTDAINAVTAADALIDALNKEAEDNG